MTFQELQLKEKELNAKLVSMVKKDPEAEFSPEFQKLDAEYWKVRNEYEKHVVSAARWGRKL